VLLEAITGANYNCTKSYMHRHQISMSSSKCVYYSCSKELRNHGHLLGELANL